MHVLIADDDRTSTTMLTRRLKQWGFEVLTANDGARAWAIVEDVRPPLAILDWMMPGIDGIQLCQRIRRHPVHAHMFLTLLTARDTQDDMLIGLDAGADNYLVKPFDPEELRARIQSGVRVVEAHAETERVLNAVPTPIVGIDATGHINRWNVAAETTFGFAAHRVMGRSLTQCGIRWEHPEMVATAYVSTAPELHIDAVTFVDAQGRRRTIDLAVVAGDHGGAVLFGSEVMERPGRDGSVAGPPTWIAR